jgi:D-alanyl-D-alanine carboxypeptidase/D-alanyl-D-alanine-endopeptidase (penicillin-binding protein 4)
VRFVRRVGDPRVLPGKVLSVLLGQLGVKVSGKVRNEPRQGGERLAYLTSDPLPVLLRQLGKHSDNFYAETIFKSLAGDDPKHPASSEGAAKLVLEWLNEAGLSDKRTKVTNGSGLFNANRLSAELLAGLLSKVYKDPKVATDFVAQLAIGGRDGTLRSRFRGKDVAGRVRAKTGTLRSVDTLGGYAYTDEASLPRVFVVLVNGIDGRHAAVRREIDRAVSALVSE